MDLPIEFLDEMKLILGEEYEAFVNSYNQTREYGLRRNPLKALTEESFEEKMPFFLERIPWTECGYFYKPDEEPGKSIYHEAGAFYIQEPSAMSVADLLGIEKGDFVCDMCAAPGGKSTQAAGLLGGTGLLVSNEINAGRAKILSQNIERMGVRNAVVLNEDTDKLGASFSFFFDKVIVDAPCSGEGMFRKNPEAVSEWSPDSVVMCRERQLMILENADRILKYGGRLVYSTCTFERKENEEVVEEFISNHPWYEIVRMKRFWPHKDRGEGHFAAVLEKKGVPSDRAKMRPGKAVFCPEYEDFVQSALKISLPGRIEKFGEHLYLIPEEMKDLKGLRVVRAGLELGELKKNRFEPAHALAMALLPEEAVSTLELSEEDAMRYIRGESVSCNGQFGWTLVTYNGYSLGWAKCGGNTAKNHYPKGLRIYGGY